jgi:hypothetical protein
MSKRKSAADQASLARDDPTSELFEAAKFVGAFSSRSRVAR